MPATASGLSRLACVALLSTSLAGAGVGGYAQAAVKVPRKGQTFAWRELPRVRLPASLNAELASGACVQTGSGVSRYAMYYRTGPYTMVLCNMGGGLVAIATLIAQGGEWRLSTSLGVAGPYGGIPGGGAPTWFTRGLPDGPYVEANGIGPDFSQALAVGPPADVVAVTDLWSASIQQSAAAQGLRTQRKSWGAVATYADAHGWITVAVTAPSSQVQAILRHVDWRALTNGAVHSAAP